MKIFSFFIKLSDDSKITWEYKILLPSRYIWFNRLKVKTGGSKCWILETQTRKVLLWFYLKMQLFQTRTYSADLTKMSFISGNIFPSWASFQQHLFMSLGRHLSKYRKRQGVLLEKTTLNLLWNMIRWERKI